MDAEISEVDRFNVQRILDARSVYEVLRVNSNILDDPEWMKKVTKMYRKLCLTVHPDKNHAPKSVEAFRILTAAYNTIIETRSNSNVKSETKPTPMSSYHDDPFINEWFKRAHAAKQAKEKPNVNNFGGKFSSSASRNFEPTMESKSPCQAKTASDEPCKKWAKQGVKYCTSHKNYDPNVKKEPKAPSVKCASLTKDGKPCQKYAQKDSLFCNMHKKNGNI